MTAALAWLAAILAAWAAGTAAIWVLHRSAQRVLRWALDNTEGPHAPCRAQDEAHRQAREQARDECAADAIGRWADTLADDEYRALCEKEDGGRG